MTNTLYNLARMTTTTTGTGTVSLISAVDGYLTFEDAGVQNADVVTYAIHEGSNSEVGQGTYTSSGATLSRDTVYASTNAGTQITLSGAAQVFITAAAEDFASLVDASGTPVNSQIAVWTDANTIEGAATLTYDGTSVLADGTLLLKETAAAAADQAGYGQIWVKNDSPNTLYFTNDAGTDVQIATSATGYVDTIGTPVDNQIAVFADADTIEGDTGLTYTSGVLQVGSGDSGATINAGADNFQIKTSATSDIGMTISDGGTSSRQRIHMRASDDDLGYVFTEHDPADGGHGVHLGYQDSTDGMSVFIDFAEDGFELSTKNSASVVSLPVAGDKFVFNHGEADNGMTILSADGGASRIYLGTPADIDKHAIIGSSGSNRLTLIVDNASRYRFETAGFKQIEASAANTDDAGFGQWWVKDDAPNIPKFTDDAGNDYSIVLDTKTQTLTNKTLFPINGQEQASDPSDPAEGKYVIWMSDGTGTGDDGDILIKITAGGVTKTATLIDFSAV